MRILNLGPVLVQLTKKEKDFSKWGTNVQCHSIKDNNNSTVCGCVFEINMDDICIDNRSIILNKNINCMDFYFDCPVCGNLIYINALLIPEKIKEAVINKTLNAEYPKCKVYQFPSRRL